MKLEHFKNSILEEKNLITKSNLINGGLDCCGTQSTHTVSTAIVSWDYLCSFLLGDDGDACYKDDEAGDWDDEGCC